MGRRFRRSVASRRLNQFDFSVTFEELEDDDEFVVDRAFAQTMFVAIGHELQVSSRVTWST